MTFTAPIRSPARRTAFVAALAIAASGFASAGADVAEANPCRPDLQDLCGIPVIEKKQLRFPPFPVCLSCPDGLRLSDFAQEIVNPAIELGGGVRLGRVALEGIGTGFGR